MKIIALADLPVEGVSHDPGIAKKVIIGDGELPHLRKFSQARFAPEQVAHYHAHIDMYEVFLVESGEGTIWTNGQAYQLTEGTCVVIEPAEPHEIINTGSTELVLTYFGLEA